MTEVFPPRQQPSAWVSVILILLTAFFGFSLIGPLIGFFFAMAGFEGSLATLVENITNGSTDPSMWVPNYLLQGSATLFGLIAGPWLLYRIRFQASPTELFKATSWRPALLVCVLVIVFSIVDSVVVSWNNSIHFPGAFDEFVRSLEARAAEVTHFMTTFHNPLEFSTGLFVIALLPAIGEELVFRGMIQRELQRWSGNAHLAIWTAAIIFSAFHLQFLGFAPRVLLGALFGYLYYWSGNLWIPVVGHLFNNGMLVTLIYLNQLGITKIDMESTEPSPVMLVIASVFGTAFLLSYLKRTLSAANS
ncbi:MAG: CPBP family intramembrane metalloprotease [Cyclobacteriaceae bacterium]|nr:CPBP family intramembrane metalloprotease [Cyclobacteriaceae bacterium]